MIPKIKTFEAEPINPIWEVDITTESGKRATRLVDDKEAEEYLKSGFPIKMRTSVGELRKH